MFTQAFSRKRELTPAPRFHGDKLRGSDETTSVCSPKQLTVSAPPTYPSKSERE